MSSFTCRRLQSWDEIWSDIKFFEDIPIPPLEISVDYGDGSPIELWTKENPTYIWGHEYAYGGTYNIKVHGKYCTNSMKREC